MAARLFTDFLRDCENDNSEKDSGMWYSFDTLRIVEEEFDNLKNSGILWNGNKVLEKKYYLIDRKPAQKMVEIVNRYKGFKGIRLADIESVKAGAYKGGPFYYFSFSNRKYTLTINKDSKNMSPRN